VPENTTKTAEVMKTDGDVDAINVNDYNEDSESLMSPEFTTHGNSEDNILKPDEERRV
jgi:hypothetical protein